MILIVDDADTSRALIHAAVAPLRRETLEATNGRDGLALLAQHPVSLIITDDRMPVMTGAEMIRIVRQRHPTLGIILVTAYEAPAEPLDWVGCNAILHKPFATGALLALAESLITPLPTPRNPH